MTDLNDAASVMFPNMPTAPQVAAPAHVTAADQEAAKFYGHPVPALTPTPQRAAQSADADAAAVLFADSPIHGDAERIIRTGVMEQDMIAPEAADAIVSEWSPIFSQYELNASESRALADVGMSVYRSPPDEATIDRWVDESREVLQRDYPLDQIAAVIKDAQTLVARNPKLKAWLAETGAGNHPQIVRAVCQRAHQARRAGKL